MAEVDRAEFCDGLGLHLAEAMEQMGIEDADMSDGRALADVVYCLGYRLTTPPPPEPTRTAGEGES